MGKAGTKLLAARLQQIITHLQIAFGYYFITVRRVVSYCDNFNSNATIVKPRTDRGQLLNVSNELSW